ncbi:hypothetical protein EYF80_054738 [Liparis tanakae]|uniref:Uncharacterized protein n=1 Tax=Liparis tanakae TaxID=230148 RepID=A0A4Z2F217_9TELE|nr:hypothetical protein EYF80_054738 [Liparis tanakae]
MSSHLWRPQHVLSPVVSSTCPLTCGVLNMSSHLWCPQHVLSPVVSSTCPLPSTSILTWMGLFLRLCPGGDVHSGSNASCMAASRPALWSFERRPGPGVRVPVRGFVGPGLGVPGPGPVRVLLSVLEATRPCSREAAVVS